MREDEILEAEESLKSAMESSNVDVLDQLIDDELIFTTHYGQVISKADDLNVHRSGNLIFEEIDLKGHKILIHEGIAVVSVTAMIKATFCGDRADGDFKFTRVWSRSSGVLRVIAGHASRNA